MNDHGGVLLAPSVSIKSKSLWYGLYHWFRFFLRTRRLQITFQTSLCASVSPRIDWSPYIQNFPECVVSVVKNHDFSVNWNKKGRGLLQIRFNGNFFWIFSRLIGPQEGLSISTLWVEKSVLQVTDVIRHVLLGSGLNKDTNFYQKYGFGGPKLNEIGFRFDINKQTDNHHFFINFLHTWRWWEIISWRLRSDSCVIIEIHAGVTFIYQRVTLSESL